MSRILVDTAATIDVTVYDANGDPVDFAPTPAPTLQIVNADSGEVILAATSTGVTEQAGGKLQYTLSPTQNADVVRMRATWSATVGTTAMQWVTDHQVVGDLLFTLAAARIFDRSALSSETTYPDATIAAMRDLVAESFEDVTGVPMGTRYRREILDGSGGRDLWLAGNRCTAIRSVKTRAYGSSTWTAFTAAELADLLLDENGLLERESLGVFTNGRRNIAVEYECGYQPIPEELRTAALWLARDRLAGTDIPRNAISQNSELGNFSLATPGLRGSFYGLPQVDEVVHRYTRRVPGVA